MCWDQQILLNLAGVSPIQAKDFWVTPEARRLKSGEGYPLIDNELLRIEERTEGCIFDTITQPWRHKRPALCIWLESDLRSRVLKSIVSHRGRGTMEADDYPDLLNEKDGDTQRLCRQLYGIEVGNDYAPFDLVLDISGLIAEPTLDASIVSIATAHRIIRAAAAWYLTGRRDFELEFRAAVSEHPELIKVNKLPE